MSPYLYMHDDIWQKIETFLPQVIEKKKSGRPRMDDRQAMDAIYYVLYSGCRWKDLPARFGAASTVHDRFLFWKRQGVLETLLERDLLHYDGYSYIKADRKAS